MLPVLKRVIEGHIIFVQKTVNVQTGLKAEQTADGIFGELAVTVALNGEGFEREPRWVLARGSEFGSKCVRDFDGQLHILRITVSKRVVDELFGFAAVGDEAAGEADANAFDEAVSRCDDFEPQRPVFDDFAGKRDVSGDL